MKIAFVLVSYAIDEPAGMERSVAALVRGLTPLGHDCAIIAAGPPRANDNDSIIRLQALRFSPPITDGQLFGLIRDNQALLEELQRLQEEYAFDIICWVGVLWGLGFIGKPRGNLASILWLHVLSSARSLRRCLSDSSPDRVIVPSQFVFDLGKSFNFCTADWKVVPNGLYSTCSEVPSSDELAERFLHAPIRSIARFSEEKGLLELIDSVPTSIIERFEVVGAMASFEQHVKAQAKYRELCLLAAQRKGVTISTKPLGWSEVPKFLAGASITVIPSAKETFGLVALESLSVGTPVASFDVGNLPSLLDGCGIVIPYKDGPDGLWSKVSELLQDPKEYIRISKDGIRRSESFSNQRVAQSWITAIFH